MLCLYKISCCDAIFRYISCRVPPAPPPLSFILIWVNSKTRHTLRRSVSWSPAVSSQRVAVWCIVMLCYVMLNRVLSKTFGAASEEGTGDCKQCIMRFFTVLVGYKKICRARDPCGVDGKRVRGFGLETGWDDTIWNAWA